MIQKTTETGGAVKLKLLTKQQSIGFDLSLTESWNSTTSLFGHTVRFRRPVNKHTYTNDSMLPKNSYKNMYPSLILQLMT